MARVVSLARREGTYLLHEYVDPRTFLQFSPESVVCSSSLCSFVLSVETTIKHSPVLIVVGPLLWGVLHSLTNAVLNAKSSAEHYARRQERLAYRGPRQ